MRYWSVVNESDVKQTKSISNRSNPFSDKIGNNKNIHTTCIAALPPVQEPQSKCQNVKTGQNTFIWNEPSRSIYMEENSHEI